MVARPLVSLLCALVTLSFGARAWASGPTPQRVVLLVPPALAGEAGEALEAIRAQMAGSQVELVVDSPEPARSVPSDIRSAIEAASAAAQKHGALGTFWLDVRPPNDIVLYLFEPEGSRVLLRRVHRKDAAPSAAYEEVAAIVRSTTTALREGREIGMESIGPEPPPPPPAVEPAPKREPHAAADLAHAWLALTYAGDTYANAHPWQSGGGVSAALAPVRSLYAGAGLTFYPPFDFTVPGATASLTRLDFDAFFGLVHSAGPLALGGEIAFVVDDSMRDTVEHGPQVRAAPSSSQASFGGAVRARLWWSLPKPLEWLRFVGGIGAEVLPGTPEYFGPEGGPPALAPWTAHLVVDCGVAATFL